jgi:hypothetical protein
MAFRVPSQFYDIVKGTDLSCSAGNTGGVASEGYRDLQIASYALLPAVS